MGQQRAINLALFRPRLGVGAGGVVDPEGAFLEATTSGTGRRRAPILGNAFPLDRTGTTRAATADRIHWCGPYRARRTGTIAGVYARLKAGTSSQQLRGLISVDNGGSSWTQTNRNDSPGRPSTTLAAGTATTIASGTGTANRFLPFATPVSVTEGQLYWLGTWNGPASSGAECQYLRQNTVSRHSVNTLGGVAPYHATNAPPGAVAAGDLSWSHGHELSIWAEISPTVSGTMSITATAQADRSILLGLSGVPSNATAIRIERAKNGGGFLPFAHVPAGVTSLRDHNKELGASYQYRATPLCFSGDGASATSSAAVATGSRRGYVATSYSLSTSRVDNPLRGVVNEVGSGSGSATTVYGPSGISARVDYIRVPVTWRTLEPTKNSYSATVITNARATAVAAGRRYSFRVRAMIDDGNNCPDYALAEGIATSYGGDVEPRWNDEALIVRLEALIAWLGTQFGDDPRLACIDAGIFRKYGEWAGGFGGAAPTVATVKRILDAWAAAFPNTFIFMNMPDTDLDEALWYAAETYYPRFGFRYDAFGGIQGGGSTGNSNTFERFRGRRSERTRALIDDDHVPVVVEHMNPVSLVDPASYQASVDEVRHLGISAIFDTNLANYSSRSSAGKAAIDQAYLEAGFLLGVTQAITPETMAVGAAFDVRLDWVNTGNAPTFEARPVTIQLRPAGGGSAVWTGTSGLDLRTVVPTEGSPISYPDTFTLTGSIPAGSYQLYVRVAPLNVYDVPLALTNSGATSDGAYPIGAPVSVS